MIKSLDRLFDLLTGELKEGKPLSACAPLLEQYSGTDWKPFKFFSSSHYTRITLKINDLLEMVIICWDIDQGCQVHDHPRDGCLLKVLQGEAEESVYQLSYPPILLNVNHLKTNMVTFRQGDTIGHQINNRSGKRTCSLHIYAPPNYRPAFYISQ